MNEINMKNKFFIFKIMSKLRFWLLLFFIPLISRGQTSVLDREYFPDFYIGIIAGYSMHTYKGTISTYEKSNECGTFTDGDGKGLIFGLKMEYNLTRKLNLLFSLLYEDRGGNFNSSIVTAPVFVDDNTLVKNASLEEKLESKINTFSLNPMIKFKPFDVDFGIIFGPSISFITSDEITHNESILSPNELYFLKTRSKTRTVLTDKINSKSSMLLDLKTGLSYGIPINGYFKITPEIFYFYPLIKVSSNSDWKISGLQVFLSFSYAIIKN